MAVREKISAWTLNAYPGVLRAAMTVFDLPETIAVSRSAICSAGGLAGLTRLQVTLLPLLHLHRSIDMSVLLHDERWP